jgi:hypothetical protein
MNWLPFVFVASAVAELDESTDARMWQDFALCTALLIKGLARRHLPLGELRARTLNQMGDPAKPKASRIWFSRKRS